MGNSFASERRRSWAESDHERAIYIVDRFSPTHRRAPTSNALRMLSSHKLATTTGLTRDKLLKTCRPRSLETRPSPSSMHARITAFFVKLCTHFPDGTPRHWNFPRTHIQFQQMVPHSTCAHQHLPANFSTAPPHPSTLGESCVSTSNESESDREPTANVVSLDCETVGCVPNEEWRKNAIPLSGRKKSKRMENNLALVAAHCAIVDYNCRTLYETYISTDMTIVEYRSISPKNLRNGKPFKEAREEILSLLKGKVVVVHDAQKDMRYLQISHNDIPYSNVRDTATCPLLHKKAKDAGKAVGVPTASLRQLARGVLNKGIHRKGPHSPVEDAKVAMELYRCVEEEWERSNAKSSIPMSLTVGLTLHLAYNCSCLL